MKKILFLIFVVFVSACIQSRPVKVDANNGIMIQTFKANPIDVYDRNTVTFYLDVENLGGNTAYNIQAELIGLENVWGSGYTKPSAVARMNPPQPADNIPGDYWVYPLWEVDAPDLSEGDVVSFPVKARVTYDYGTGSAIVIKAISYERNRILANKGETVANPVSMSNEVNGPVKIKLVKGQTPLIIDPEEGIIEKTYRLEIQNVGDGWPITDNVIGKLTGSIELHGTGFTLKGCSGIVGSPKNFYVIVRSDGSAPISCTVEVDPKGWERDKEDVFFFKSAFSFRYYVEKDVSVTIRGTEKIKGMSAPPTVDKRKPITYIVSPSEGSWQSNSFIADVSDYDLDSGLSLCEYMVVSSGIETLRWTTRPCSERISITVGCNKDCRDSGPNACMLVVRSRDKSGNVGQDSIRFGVDTDTCTV